MNQYIKHLYARCQTYVDLLDRKFADITDTGVAFLKAYHKIYFKPLEQRRTMFDAMNMHSEFDENDNPVS